MTNISQIMKQAKAMQEKMAEAQKKVEETEVEGSSGGWWCCQSYYGWKI